MKSLMCYKKHENGQSLVEFALILPILLLLLMGLIQFGFIFNGQIILTSAVREGARLAVIDKNNDDKVKDRVLKEVTEKGLLLKLDKDKIIITRESSNDDLPKGMLNVSAKGSVDIIVPFLEMLIKDPDNPNQFSLFAESKMRKEYQEQEE